SASRTWTVPWSGGRASRPTCSWRSSGWPGKPRVRLIIPANRQPIGPFGQPAERRVVHAVAHPADAAVTKDEPAGAGAPTSGPLGRLPDRRAGRTGGGDVRCHG